MTRRYVIHTTQAKAQKVAVGEKYSRFFFGSPPAITSEPPRVILGWKLEFLGSLSDCLGSRLRRKPWYSSSSWSREYGVLPPPAWDADSGSRIISLSFQLAFR